MKLAFLRLPVDERRLYVEQAAIRRNLSPIIIEKDLWVCWLVPPESRKAALRRDFQAMQIMCLQRLLAAREKANYSPRDVQFGHVKTILRRVPNPQYDDFIFINREYDSMRWACSDAIVKLTKTLFYQGSLWCKWTAFRHIFKGFDRFEDSRVPTDSVGCRTVFGPPIIG